MSSAPRTRRLVAVDCETNGLFGDVRILSLAMVELRHGIAYNSKLWVMNPGNVPMDPGALAVNGLTPEMLASAASFSEHCDEVREWLTVKRGERLTLVGHKVAFDARQLRGEFARLGQTLPPLDLLDTSGLAQAARVIPANQSLDALLRALSLTNSAPHTALGDTLATASAALSMLARLGQNLDATQLATLLDTLAVPYDGAPDKPLTREKPSEPLSEQHISAHLMDLTDGRRRRRSLDVCVIEDCSFLATRMEDGIVAQEHASQVVEWALTWLEDYDLPRTTSGHLLRGLGQALRRSEDPDFAIGIYRSRLVPLLGELGPCGKKAEERCVPCQRKEGTCDFDAALRHVVDATLHNSSKAFTQPNLAKVEAFLPGYNPRVGRNRGRPAQGLYGELLRNGHIDAAGYGVFRVAEVRRVEGGRAWAHTLLNKAWRDGCRTPQMTEMLASMTVVDGVIDGVTPEDPKAPVAAAVSYLDECLALYKGRQGRIFADLGKRRIRLRAQLDAPPKQSRDPEKAVNLRAPHITMLVDPLANTAVPGTPVKKRGRGRPKGSKSKVRF